MGWKVYPKYVFMKSKVCSKFLMTLTFIMKSPPLGRYLMSPSCMLGVCTMNLQLSTLENLHVLQGRVESLCPIALHEGIRFLMSSPFHFRCSMKTQLACYRIGFHSNMNEVVGVKVFGTTFSKRVSSVFLGVHIN